MSAKWRLLCLDLKYTDTLIAWINREQWYNRNKTKHNRRHILRDIGYSTQYGTVEEIQALDLWSGAPRTTYYYIMYIVDINCIIIK